MTSLWEPGTVTVVSILLFGRHNSRRNECCCFDCGTFRFDFLQQSFKTQGPSRDNSIFLPPVALLWPKSIIFITFTFRGGDYIVTAVGTIKCFSGIGVVQRPLCWACLSGWFLRIITVLKSIPNLHNLGKIHYISPTFGKILLGHLSIY